MDAKYDKSRPSVPAELRREAEIEAGHQCSIAHCREHTYLDLHHIDGNRENNQIDNVILLCPKHHRMAERQEIDRKSLREYKRINRERVYGGQVYELTESQRSQYLVSVQSWLDRELTRIEKSPLEPEHNEVHIPPTFRFRDGTTFDSSVDSLDKLIQERNGILLLGNGGSGKTVATLTWLKRICEQKTSDYERLPVYVSLSNMTVNSDIYSLVRSFFAGQGVTLSVGELEGLLLRGMLALVLDGLNEINKHTVEQGAIEDILNFINLYSTNSFVLSSRYIESVQKFNLYTVDILSWNKDQIRQYLDLRLGRDLGEATYQSLGDELDFEWLRECSIAGFCSNPLTLWMLASTVEKSGHPPVKNSDAVNTLVELMVQHVSDQQIKAIPRSLIHEALKQFAYLTVEAGEVLSLGHEKAIRIAQRLLQNQNLSIPLPQSCDAYDLLSVFIATGLLKQVGDRIDWIHQIIQERLAIEYSRELFRKVDDATSKVLCPHCGYRPEEFYEAGGEIYGICPETDAEFKVSLPVIPHGQKLKRRLRFVDKTGLPTEEGMTSIPNSYHDEGYMRLLPLGGTLFMIGLSFAQDISFRQIEREDFMEYLQLPKPLFELEVWSLVEWSAPAKIE